MVTSDVRLGDFALAVDTGIDDRFATLFEEELFEEAALDTDFGLLLLRSLDDAREAAPDTDFGLLLRSLDDAPREAKRGLSGDHGFRFVTLRLGDLEFEVLRCAELDELLELDELFL